MVVESVAGVRSLPAGHDPLDWLSWEGGSVFGRDKEVARKWLAVINAVLGIRNNHRSDIRRSGFDGEGQVRWNLEVTSDFDLSTAL